MTEFYIGITVGPIIETLMTASRPAALWCASSMFSWLTEDICNGLLKYSGHIISPYYPKKMESDSYSVITEKAGKYHDRIIGRIQAESSDDVKKIIESVINDAKRRLAGTLVTKKLAPYNDENSKLNSAVVQYLQVHYIIEEKSSEDKRNCILRLSPYLDAAELCPVFNADQTLQPILRLFEGKNDEARNALLKKCFHIKDGHTSLLNSDGNIRDIEHIADICPEDNRKIYHYYAVVQADGDCIGKLLGTLHSDKEVEQFSMT